MTAYKLFIDDERSPQDVTWIDLPKGDWVIVRTVEAFEKTLRECGRPYSVSFDNDLQTEKEGRHAARILCELCMEHNWDLPECFIHSKNNVAAETIESILSSYARSRSMPGNRG